MFLRPSGGKRTGSIRPVQGTERFSNLIPPIYLSREFFKIVNFVLDRSQFNRIISHNNEIARFVELLFGLLWVQRLASALALIYTALSLPANAPPE